MHFLRHLNKASLTPFISNDPRAVLCALAWLTLVIVFSSYFGTRCFANANLDKQFLDAQGRAFAYWLSGTGLSHLLEYIKVRRSPHPNDTIYGEVYRLELRMKPQGEGEEYDLAYFRKYAEEFEKANHIPLQERLFYKFTHLLNVSPHHASVHVHIYAMEFSSYFSDAGTVITTHSSPKMVQKDANIAGFDNSQVPRNLGNQHETHVDGHDGITIPRIKNWLEDRYKKRTALFITTSSDDDTIGFTVREIKQEILTGNNYWEKIQVTLILSSQSSTVRCFVDAWYLPGGGRKPPSSDEGYKDMENKFSSRLQEYSAKLLDDLISDYKSGSL